MKKKIIALLICAVLLLSQMSALAFKIINGYDAKTFGPEDPVKRVDSLLLVSRILGASDSAQEAYLEAAYSKYFSNVNVLGYSAYEKTLAYLLYRDIYATSDLKAFVSNGAGDKTLQRYEAAVILVKVMGAEKVVQLNTKPELAFDDGKAWLLIFCRRCFKC